MKHEKENIKVSLMHHASCIMHLIPIIFVAFVLLVPISTSAQIIPIPGTTCAYDQNPEECRKNICPCLEREADGKCKEGSQYMCFAGKCGLTGEDAAIANLPCNFTLDDIVLSTINVAKFIIGITGSLMLLFVAYGGYQYVTAMGNAEGIQGATKILTAAFVGLIIVFAASLLVRFATGLILPGPGEPGATIPSPAGGALPKIKVE